MTILRSFHRSVAMGVVSAAAFASMSCASLMWPNDDVNLARCAQGGFEYSDRTGFDRDQIAFEASVDPTDRSLTNYDIGVQGTGKDLIGKVDLEGGVGTIEIGCTSTALAVISYDPGFTYDYVYALGIGKEGLYPIDFICSHDGNLMWIEYDGTDRTKKGYDNAKGRCQIDDTRQATERFESPRTRFRIPRLLTGYTIDGPSIHLASGEVGNIRVDGGDYRLAAFSAVDCGEGCEGSPWHEIRALIVDPNEAFTAYAALVERPGDPVTISKTVKFPGFEQSWASDTEFSADFSTP